MNQQAKDNAGKGAEVFMLEAWVADNPGSRLFLKLAKAYRDQGRAQEAVEVLQKGLLIRPNEIEARHLLAGILRGQGDDEGALAQLTQAAQEIARHAGVFEQLAGIWDKKGRADEAAWAQGLAQALVPPSDETPEPPAALSQDTVTMAEIYAEQGHLDQAAAIYRKLVAKSPGDAELAARLAELSAGRPPAPPSGAAPSDRVTSRLMALQAAAQKKVRA